MPPSRPQLTLGRIGRALIDLSGEEPCKASLFKMIGNVFIMTTMETVAELNVFSEKSGLGIQYMRNFIEMLLPDSLHLIYWDKMASGEYYQKEVFHSLLRQKKYNCSYSRCLSLW
jgi:3-hydroxyisobutyrate dehydrogenase-like beta-hydroxyacid dehydrogenase